MYVYTCIPVHCDDQLMIGLLPVIIVYFPIIVQPSQPTTDAEGDGEGLGEDVSGREVMIGEGESDRVSSSGTEAVLQALNTAVAKTMSDEQEALGKVIRPL